MLIVDEWSEFKDLSLSEEVYNDLWNNFNVGDLASVFLT